MDSFAIDAPNNSHSIVIIINYNWFDLCASQMDSGWSEWPTRVPPPYGMLSISAAHKFQRRCEMQTRTVEKSTTQTKSHSRAQKKWKKKVIIIQFRSIISLMPFVLGSLYRGICTTLSYFFPQLFTVGSIHFPLIEIAKLDKRIEPKGGERERKKNMLSRSLLRQLFVRIFSSIWLCVGLAESERVYIEHWCSTSRRSNASVGRKRRWIRFHNVYHKIVPQPNSATSRSDGREQQLHRMEYKNILQWFSKNCILHGSPWKKVFVKREKIK